MKFLTLAEQIVDYIKNIKSKEQHTVLVVGKTYDSLILLKKKIVNILPYYEGSELTVNQLNIIYNKHIIIDFVCVGDNKKLLQQNPDKTFY